MDPQVREPSRMASQRNPYPQLGASAVAALNRQLVEIVSLLHGGNLTEAQMREVTASVAVQTANVEKLHQFSLSNADEPAFAAVLTRATADDR
jgi:hypothetical protein